MYNWLKDFISEYLVIIVVIVFLGLLGAIAVGKEQLELEEEKMVTTVTCSNFEHIVTIEDVDYAKRDFNYTHVVTNDGITYEFRGYDCIFVLGGKDDN